MKKRAKFLTFLLAVFLIISMMPAMAFADEGGSSEDLQGSYENEEEAEESRNNSEEAGPEAEGLIEIKDDTSVTEYPVWVGATQVTSENADNVLGDDEKSVTYDPDSCTLTLTDATVDGKYTVEGQSEYSSNIYSEGIDLTIKLAGTNTVGSEEPAAYAIDIEDDDTDDDAVGSLTITGGGSLSVTGKEDAIYADESVNINGSTVKAASKGDGICAYNGDIDISNSTVTATGSYYGIDSNDKNIRISDSTVTVTGGIGICSDIDTEISGSTVNATGDLIGICTYSGTYITDSTVTATAAATSTSKFGFGIYASGGDINIAGSSVKAVTNYGAGILGYKSMVIDNSKIYSEGSVGAVTKLEIKNSDRKKTTRVEAASNIDGFPAVGSMAMSIGDDLQITEPSGGKIADEQKVIEIGKKSVPAYVVVDEDGETAESVVIESTAREVSSDPLIAAAVSNGKKGLKLSWNEVSGADGYDVFLARCNTSKKKYTCKKVAAIEGSGVTSWKATGLKARTAYKGYVKAYVVVDGVKTYVKKSPTFHAYTGGYNAKYTNAKSLKLKKSKVTVKKGKTYKIKASVARYKKSRKLMSTSHVSRLRYLSSDTSIATVTRYGTVKGKSAGTCKIYVYTANGICKKMTVTVK